MSNENERNWYESYSPIPLENVSRVFTSQLTPKEVVVAKTDLHWVYTVKAFFSLSTLLVVPFFIKIFVINKKMGVVLTNQRLIGSANVKLTSTDKLDIPLRSVDSLATDDTFFGNVFGYSKIKIMSRASTYFIPYCTKASIQTIKNAYYDWDAKKS